MCYSNWQCTDCKTIFDKEDLLHAHLKQQHLSYEDAELKQETAYTCVICGDKFDSPGELKIHKEKYHMQKKLQSQEKSFKCMICYKVFASIDRVQVSTLSL